MIFTAKILSAFLVFQSCQGFRFSNRRMTSIASLKSSTENTDDVDLSVDFDKLASESAAEAFTVKPELSGAMRTEEPKPPRQAGWFPLLLSPDYLDGSMAGDVGFDPFGLSSRPGGLFWMREAEVKHSRLAMLAAIGWPMSELRHNDIAQALGWENILVDGDKAPSVLNGGMNNVWIISALAFSVVLGGVLELIAMKDGNGPTFEDKRRPDGFKPGNFNFDPLRLYGIRTSFYLDKIAENLSREQIIERAKFDMELTEIKNGRLAMIAIVGMVVQELVLGNSIVEQTPFFFGDPLQ